MRREIVPRFAGDNSFGLSGGNSERTYAKENMLGCPLDLAAKILTPM
jgi:hypothetical protein